MIWDKVIQADGCIASPEQQTEAWARWLRGDRRTATSLAACLTHEGAGFDGAMWRNMRVADRMLQKARKAGVIRFEGSKWIEVKS